MTVQRDPDAILAAWLEEGPDPAPRGHEAGDRRNHPNHPSNAAPDVAAVEVPDHEWMSRLALAAVAVVAVVARRAVLSQPAPEGGVRWAASAAQSRR